LKEAAVENFKNKEVIIYKNYYEYKYLPAYLRKHFSNNVCETFASIIWQNSI